MTSKRTTEKWETLEAGEWETLFHIMSVRGYHPCTAFQEHVIQYDTLREALENLPGVGTDDDATPWGVRYFMEDNRWGGGVGWHAPIDWDRATGPLSGEEIDLIIAAARGLVNCTTPES